MIGGSTEEAQFLIGQEVGGSIVKFLNSGGTVGAVNYPEIALKSLQPGAKCIRILHTHQNVPGVLKVTMKKRKTIFCIRII